MRKITIILLGFVAVMMSSCYSHRVIGYLQEPTKSNKLPVYDSVPYQPYRIRVNDEIIYRLVTMDETYSKMLGANTMTSGQYANSYRVYSDGTIDLPVRIKEGHTIQREAGSGGVPAVTHYTALCSSYGHTLLRITLETGRTHQIRTHLSHIGHPLAGDDMYGGSTRYFDRQCLHCAEATLVHPVSRETLRLRCEPEPWLSMLSQYHQE